MDRLKIPLTSANRWMHNGPLDGVCMPLDKNVHSQEKEQAEIAKGRKMLSQTGGP